MPHDDSTHFSFLSRRFTRRDVLKGALIGGAALSAGPLLAACGGESTTTSPSAAASPKTGGILKSGIVGGSAKDTLDAHVAPTEPMIANVAQLYNRLVEYTPDFKLVNVLAEDVSSNAEATVWTVTLRPDLVFSNGKAITADDVVFTFNRILDPKDPKSGLTSLVGLTPKGVKKLDARTVQFTLDKASAIFPEQLAYRENSIVPVGYDPRKPIGSGPFVLKSFNPGQQTVFVPNKNWFGEGPYVDELHIIQFADPTARVNALLSGAVDHCDQVASAQAATIKAASGYQILETRSGGWQPFTMRIDVAPFSDVRVRQALRLIPERQQMIDQAYAGFGWVGNDMYAPFDPGFPKDVAQRVQDLEQAKSLLKQAGQENLSVELITSTAIGAGGVEMCSVFAEQAKGAGVTVNVKKVDPGVFYGDQYLSWPFAVDFWGTRNYLLQTTQGTAKGAPYNETHWEDAEWQKIVDEAFATPDDAKRNELISEASKIEFERGGNIIWAFNVLMDGYSGKLGGLVNDVFLNSAMGFRYHLVYFQ